MVTFIITNQLPLIKRITFINYFLFLFFNLIILLTYNYSTLYFIIFEFSINIKFMINLIIFIKFV